MTVELKTFTSVLPAAPGTCPECATVHPPEQPHARQSLFYQYRYCQQYGRFPSWNDAMAHCAPAIQRQWREGLRECGYDVPEPQNGPEAPRTDVRRPNTPAGGVTHEIGAIPAATKKGDDYAATT